MATRRTKLGMRWRHFSRRHPFLAGLIVAPPVIAAVWFFLAVALAL